jgi:hypothetical protein
MKNRYVGLLLLLLSVSALWAQVNTNELQQGQGTVEFLNNTGPVSRVDTVSQIRNIGYEQGVAIRRGGSRSGPANRYFVIHSVTAPDGQRMDADIFGLGASIGVDHIRNLRLIIQGYLEGAYNYSAQDARLLAQYVTVYNAVYRGNWNFFNVRYKQAVLQNLTPERVGLSLRFDEWPGRTLIVIPLGNASPDSLSAIDTSAISDKSVVDELREGSDQGLDTRKAMVELKEREADEAEKRADNLRAAIADEEARIAAERARIAAERRKLRDDLAAGNITPEQARQLEEGLAAQEGALNEQDRALDEQRQAAENLDQLAEDKMTDAQRDREGIAADQTPAQPATTPDDSLAATDDTTDNEQATTATDDETTADATPTDNETTEASTTTNTTATPAQNQQPPADGVQANQDTGGTKIMIVMPTSATSPLGTLVLINVATGRQTDQSSLSTVNARSLVSIGQGTNEKLFATITTGNSVQLIQIDQQEMGVAAQNSNADIDSLDTNSPLWVVGNLIYAIVKSGNQLFFGCFDTAAITDGVIPLTAKSTSQVHPYAAARFQGDTILIQQPNGQAAVLNARDLSTR